jgi:hypothetical protein
MKKLFPVFFICISWVQLPHAQIKIGKDAIVEFASVDQARQILTAQDDFVLRMSPFDRASRMKTNRNVSTDVYLEFVGRNVLAWNDSERQKITSAIQGVQAELESLLLPFPEKVFVIKTTGDEEGGAAYTRANAIVLPEAEMTAPVEKIRKTICHELFHILSRANPDLREKLYADIGFVKCDEVAFPLELKSRKLTNPDAPKNDHCILLQVGGKRYWAVPIIFSSTDTYDVKRGGEFFNYLQFRFLPVERSDISSAVKPIYDGQKPKLIDMQQVSGFLEQVGRNTGYIIHPEEILADNFALLVLRERNVPSPSIIRKMEETLKQSRAAEQQNEPDKK